MIRKIRFFLAVFATLIFVGLGALPSSANPERWKRTGWEQTDFTKTSIEFSEIQQGGPPKDGIPAIDKP